MNPRHRRPDGLNQLRDLPPIADLEIHLGDRSVESYADNERIPEGFPRPKDHFVIADLMVDLPVVAADYAIDQNTHGRVLGYSYGRYWVVADSVSEFVEALEADGSSAVWGQNNNAEQNGGGPAATRNESTSSN